MSFFFNKADNFKMNIIRKKYIELSILLIILSLFIFYFILLSHTLEVDTSFVPESNIVKNLDDNRHLLIKDWSKHYTIAEEPKLLYDYIKLLDDHYSSGKYNEVWENWPKISYKTYCVTFYIGLIIGVYCYN